METPTLEVHHAHRIAVVWLARERVRNAFNEHSIAELSRAFTRLGHDPDVHAIVLAARGPAFCAGADLDWMRRMARYSDEENRKDARALADMLSVIHRCPKPTIARVHGDAYAGGVGLVAACDVAFAADSATFCLSETRLGLIPATISPYVIRAMGARHAQRYLVTAERFDAAEAQRIGLVHGIAAPDQLDALITKTLEALLQASATALTAAKKLVLDVTGRPIDDALLDDTAGRIAAVRASPDGREGVQSFLEKRKPGWACVYEAERAAAQPDDEEM